MLLDGRWDGVKSSNILRLQKTGSWAAILAMKLSQALKSWSKHEISAPLIQIPIFNKLSKFRNKVFEGFSQRTRHTV